MEQFANDAQSTLAAAIGVKDVKLTVADPSSFPAKGNFRLRIGDELLLVTAVEGATYTVERGVEGSEAASHVKGVEVESVLTAAALTAPVEDHEVATTSVHGIADTANLATKDELGEAGVSPEELEAAIGNEASARSKADEAEAKVRGEGDAAESTARKAAVSALEEADAGETAEREAADKAEETRAKAAEVLLQPKSEKDQANGYAGVGSDGKINVAALPAIAITSRFVVNSQAAQLALPAQEGDVAIRTDQSRTYIHNGGTAGTMADWTELATPADSVLSVAGKTGVVTLTYSDVGGLGTAATKDAGAAGAAGKVLNADDPTTSDARTPTKHAASHKTGGADALAPSDIGAAPTAHSHAQGDVIGLVAALEGKQPASTYRRIAYMPGRATTGAASGNKYICSGSTITSDITGVTVGSPFTALIPIRAADLAVAGLTTKLRVRGICQVGATAPSVNATFSLFPAVPAGSVSAGEAVAGSSVEVKAPVKEELTIGLGADFTIPADGVYLLGYAVSGAPATAFVLHAYLEVRNV